MKTGVIIKLTILKLAVILNCRRQPGIVSSAWGISALALRVYFQGVWKENWEYSPRAITQRERPGWSQWGLAQQQRLWAGKMPLNCPTPLLRTVGGVQGSPQKPRGRDQIGQIHIKIRFLTKPCLTWLKEMSDVF